MSDPITTYNGRVILFNNGVVDVKQGGVSLVDSEKVAHIPDGNVKIDELTIIKNADNELEVPIDEDTIYIDDHGFMKAKGSGKEYTAGENIEISSEGIISATDTKYTAGQGISISSEGIISVYEEPPYEPDGTYWKVDGTTLYLRGDAQDGYAQYTGYLGGTERHPWSDSITNVVTETKILLPIDCSYMFFRCSVLTTIDASIWDTSNVTKMNYMFANTAALESLDLSGFDTSNVTNMQNMFSYSQNATRLKTIYVSNKWTTGAVTNSNNMFFWASSLVGGAGTACNGYSMIEKYYARIDNPPTAPGYFTLKVEPKIIDIYGAGEHIIIDSEGIISAEWPVIPEPVEYQAGEHIIIDSENTISAEWPTVPTKVSELQNDLHFITSEDVPEVPTKLSELTNDVGFITSEDIPEIPEYTAGENVTISEGIISAEDLLGEDMLVSTAVGGYVENERITANTSLKGILVKLLGLELAPTGTYWKQEGTTLYLRGTAKDGYQEYTGSIRPWGTDITNIITETRILLPSSSTDMFYNCTALSSISGTLKWDVSSVVNLYGMFQNCSSLTSLDLSNWNTSNVTDIGRLFLNCSNLTSLDISSFDTSNVTIMKNMFGGCKNLATIYVSDKWSTASVSEGNNMFYQCTSLVGGANTTFNSSYTDVTYARIDNPPTAPGYFTLKQ